MVLRCVLGFGSALAVLLGPRPLVPFVGHYWGDVSICTKVLRRRTARCASQSFGRQTARAITLETLELPEEFVGSEHIYLLLYTYGFLPEAKASVSRALVGRQLCFAGVPRPSNFPAIGQGHAAVGQLLLGLLGEPMTEQEIPGIIQAYAFVGACRGVPDHPSREALDAVTAWVETRGKQLQGALPLTYFGLHKQWQGRLSQEPTFRASLIRDGQHDFTSAQAMVAVGSGAAGAVPWKVDLKEFDVDLVGIMHGDVLTLGLSCAAARPERKGSKSPSRLPSELRPWHVWGEVRHMRFSTATLLLEFAEVSAGESLLDLCGGAGTIALEAVTRIAGIRAVSSDRASKNACDIARENLATALSLGLLREGSSMQVACRNLHTWYKDAASLAAFDVVVTELPFGLRFPGVNPKELFMSLGWVLRPFGRAALIAPRSASFLRGLRAAIAGDAWCDNHVIREGNVGGVSVYIVLVRRSGARSEPPAGNL